MFITDVMLITDYLIYLLTYTCSDAIASCVLSFSDVLLCSHNQYAMVLNSCIIINDGYSCRLHNHIA